MPFGITLVGKTFNDAKLLSLGEKIQQLTGLAMGAGNEVPIFSGEKKTESNGA